MTCRVHVPGDALGVVAIAGEQRLGQREVATAQRNGLEDSQGACWIGS
jgi:hypothetical protein